MAIQIIKRGTPRGEEVYQATCRDCKTEFSFQADDAVREHDRRDGDFFRVGCPVCGTQCTKGAD